MSESNTQQNGGGLTGALKNNPAVSRLGDAARDYAKARGSDAVRKVAGKIGDVTESMNDKADGGGFTAPAVSTALQKVREGDNPVKAAASGVASGVKEKVKSVFGRKGGGGQKFMNIVEDVTVGVPVDVAYNQWTQFQEFSNFMKGVESVDQTDEVSTNWKVKVFKSRRNWKGTVTEQIPDRKIAWTTDGAKGSTKGVVTFHPLADDLTQVLLVMEYYPAGLFEKTGNIWRAQGRRARLDLKNFRRFIMMRGEETGSWRGEIRDGEVVRGPDEEGGDQGRAQESEEQPDTGEDQGDEYEADASADDEYEAEAGEGEEYEDEGEEDEEEEEPEEGDEEDEEEYDQDTDEGSDEGYAEDEEEEPEEEQERSGSRRREPAGAGRR